MNRFVPLFALVATLGLGACERQRTVMTVPAPAAEPGPAGRQGRPGVQGNTGQPHKTGAGTTVIVKPLPPTAIEVS